ncbi:MAG: hypothetical protein KH243_00485 [Lachnospiraceae bacterium]|nr:hypothetical protein [Lachnospiraceae bacterium]
MMINVTLATTAGKSLVTVEGNQTPSQVLEENSTTGATVSLNMRPLADNEKGKTFEELGCTDGDSVMLSAVVKADSAM